MKKYLFLTMLFLVPGISFAATPSAPQNFSVTPGLEGEYDYFFDTSWEAPLDDGGAPITEYRIYNNFNGLDYDVTSKFSYRILQEGFIRGETEYDFYVTAVNKEGEGEPSEILTVRATSSLDDEAPVISELSVSEIGQTNATVSWTTDEDSNSQINFDVHSADQHQNYLSRALTREHSFYLDGLLPCTTYFYYVSSEDESSNVSNSDIESFDTNGCLGGIINKDTSSLLSPELIRSFELNGDVDITAREGSFMVESVFQIKKLNIQEVDANVGCPANKKPIGGKIYDIKILDDFNSETELMEPVTITINYEDSDLGKIDEDDISMYHYDESASAWEKLNSCTIDKKANTITCEVSSFSKFTLMADPEKCEIKEPLERRLYLGSYGEDVMNLNNFLNESGYNAPKDSYSFGIKTLKALRKYQKDNVEKLKGHNNFWLENFFTFVGKSTISYINSTKE